MRVKGYSQVQKNLFNVLKLLILTKMQLLLREPPRNCPLSFLCYWPLWVIKVSIRRLHLHATVPLPLSLSPSLSIAPHKVKTLSSCYCSIAPLPLPLFFHCLSQSHDFSFMLLFHFSSLSPPLPPSLSHTHTTWVQLCNSKVSFSLFQFLFI